MKEVDNEKNLVEESEGMDPFAPENIGIVQTIVLMRIYDLLGAILDNLDPEVAEEIVNRHSAGKITGPFPSLDL